MSLTEAEEERRYRNAILRTNLPAFIHKVFKEVEPTDYTPNWHIDLIAEYLYKVVTGELKRVIFNVPPGYTKSVAINIAFSAFIAGHNPRCRIISASHTYGLSVRMSTKVKRIIESDWYRELFPYTKIGAVENTQDFYRFTAGGFRMASAVGKAITGEGGDVLLIDDPINAKDAAGTSGAAINGCNDWFDGTFYSRLRDKKKGVIVLIMQRLHENDLTGHLLGSEFDKYEHCIIPGVEETPGGKTYAYGDFSYYRAEGERLCDAIEGELEIAKARERLGSYGFAAQYQQIPSPAGGGMVKIEWFKRYKVAPEFKRIIQSWDTAIKAAQINDPSCCTTWGETDHGYYLLDCYVARLEYPELKRTVINHYEKWKPNIVLIEDKASGQQLLQDLKRSTTLPTIPINPTADKTTRMSGVSALIEAGRCYLPESAPWMHDYEHELMMFPNGSHDDQVDSTSQFLNYVRVPRAQPMIRVL